MGDEQVVLTRRSDGARFTIHMQARSPDGPRNRAERRALARRGR